MYNLFALVIFAVFYFLGVGFSLFIMLSTSHPSPEKFTYPIFAVRALLLFTFEQFLCLTVILLCVFNKSITALLVVAGTVSALLLVGGIFLLQERLTYQNGIFFYSTLKQKSVFKKDDISSFAVQTPFAIIKLNDETEITFKITQNYFEVFQEIFK